MSTTPLSNSREIVERSLFHAVRQELVDKGYLPDIKAKSGHTINLVTTGTKTFRVTGNATALYTAGRTFEVINSTGNNGTYTVVSSAFVTPNTNIVVSEVVPSAVADGTTSIYTYYNDPAGVIAFNTALAAIVTIKGFAIEVFGASSSQAKLAKKVPRIVIITNQSLPGSLGGAPDRIYTPANVDPLNPGSYTASILPPETVDITFDIHLVSNTAQQSRVLHGVLGLAIPKRGYVPFYTDAEQRIFVHQFSYRNIPNTIEGINQDIYMYRAEDIFETENAQVSDTGGIKPITEITINTNEGIKDDYTPFNDLVVD